MKLLLISFFSCLLLINCRDFLEEKANAKLATPETIEENQAILDLERPINRLFPTIGEMSADDYILTDQEYSALTSEEYKRAYTWQADNLMGSMADIGNDWYNTYNAIYLSNVVLYNIETYKLTGKEADDLKGQALALRAFRYLTAAQIWCQAYNKETADNDLGLPLRLDPDMNYPSVRVSVEETYQQVLKDLHESIVLLPNNPVAFTRMGKPAVYTLLARTYLYMGDYQNSLKYSLLALELEDYLMDYNQLNAQATYPVSNTNEEIIFRALLNVRHLRSPLVPNELYNLFEQNDLRKTVLFNVASNGDKKFKGNYGNSLGGLMGPATDELYLIAAESYARLDQINSAMNYLNTLLVTRWKAGMYVPKVASNKQNALEIILLERRKELIGRGLRWSDLKRFNRDGAEITLTRTVNDENFTLPPNDLRYAIEIPEEVIKLSGMQQNPK